MAVVAIVGTARLAFARRAAGYRRRARADENARLADVIASRVGDAVLPDEAESHPIAAWHSPQYYAGTKPAPRARRLRPATLDRESTGDGMDDRRSTSTHYEPAFSYRTISTMHSMVSQNIGIALDVADDSGARLGLADAQVEAADAAARREHPHRPRSGRALARVAHQPLDRPPSRSPHHRSPF